MSIKNSHLKSESKNICIEAGSAVDGKIPQREWNANYRCNDG